MEIRLKSKNITQPRSFLLSFTLSRTFTFSPGGEEALGTWLNITLGFTISSQIIIHFSHYRRSYVLSSLLKILHDALSGVLLIFSINFPEATSCQNSDLLFSNFEGRFNEIIVRLFTINVM